MNQHEQIPTSMAMEFGKLIRLYMQRSGKIHARTGMTKGQPPILLLLDHSENINQKQMAGVLGLSPATITITLQRTERAGLVLREADLNDQRVLHVRLTEKGRELCSRYRSILLETFEKTLDGFSDEEIRIVGGYMKRMAANLSENDPMQPNTNFP